MDNLNIKDEILSYCQACGSEVSDLDTTSEMLEMFKDLTRIEPICYGNEIEFCKQCQSSLQTFHLFKQLCVETQGLLSYRYENREQEVFVQYVEVKVEAATLPELPKAEQATPEFICDLCSKRSKTKRGMSLHIKVSHLKGKIDKIPCTFPGCKRKFNDQLILDCHLRQHEGKCPYQCHICSLQVKTLSSLRNHLLAHGKVRAFKCSYCDAAFTSNTNRYQHTISVHKLGKKYICQDCGYSCHNSTQFNGHVKRKHGTADYQCDQCPKRTKHPRDLVEHKESHKNLEKTVPCPDCSKLFRTHRHMVVHRRLTHKATRSHFCPTCSKSFTSITRLKKHMNIHTGEKQYFCNLCSHVSTQMQALKRHMTTHTGVRPFSCPYCNHTFAEKFYMKKHANRCSMKPVDAPPLD